MWVIVGLGNPGAEYAQTRHNAGFMVVDTIARRWGVALRAQGETLRVGSGRIAGQPALLAEPHALMNRSGEALTQLRLDVDDALVVVHDDLDLTAGQLRVRPRGGSGGHRGIASIVAHRGAEFVRVRVGIGRPPQGLEAADFVLAPLSSAERTALRADVERASDAVECIITDGTEAAMNRFNRRAAPATA